MGLKNGSEEIEVQQNENNLKNDREGKVFIQDDPSNNDREIQQ